MAIAAMMQALLFNGAARVNMRDKEGISALMIAAGQGYDSCVEQCLQKDGDIGCVDNIKKMNALMIAAYMGRTSTVEILASYGKSRRGIEFINLIDADHNTALMIASANGHAEVVAVLIKQGADFAKENEHGMNALMIAASNVHIAVVKELLSIKELDISARSKKNRMNVLMIAASNNCTEVINILLENRVAIDDIDANGDTALMIAVKKKM